jgi:hypothetical protein
MMNQEDQQRGPQKPRAEVQRALNDDQPALIVVTGIMAAGKSTIAHLLAQRFARGVHIEADVLQRLTCSPRINPGDSNNHLLGFLLRGVLPGLVFTAPGLTDSPQAATVSPTAKMFLAALISRSCWAPHPGQVQCRISRVKESRICPQHSSVWRTDTSGLS